MFKTLGHFLASRKRKIRAKILLIMLTLLITSLFVIALISIIQFEKLNRFAIKSNKALSAEAIQTSTDELQSHSRNYILQLVKDQAAISNLLFEEVEAETDIMAEYASSFSKDPSSLGHNRLYSQDEPPDNIYSTSVYVLAPGVKFANVRKELNLLSNMDNVFIPMCSHNTNLSAIFIGTESGIFCSYPWDSTFPPSFDPRNREWYRKAIEIGKLGWTELYVDATTKKLLITCFKPFHNSSGKIIGVLGTDVTMETINNRIINTQVGDAGYAFLIDKKGKIIARPSIAADDEGWDDSFETQNLLETDNPELKSAVEDMIAGNTGVRKMENDPLTDNDDKFIAYAPVHCTNWSLAVVLPFSEIIAPMLQVKESIDKATENANQHITKEKRYLFIIFIIFLFVMVMLIFAISLRLSEKITKPILALERGATIIGSGNLDYKIDINTDDEIEDLADTFNKMTMDLNEYIKDLRETTAAKEHIESELQIAHEIQASMLPRKFPPFPNRKEFDIFAVMTPAKEVAGDFYDFFFIDKSRLCFLIADVSDKGIAAALFMVISKTLLKTEAMHKNYSCEEILHRVNSLLCPENDACMFVTVFCAILNVDTGEMEYANAGHDPPLIYRNGVEFEFLKLENGIALGVMDNVKFVNCKLNLNSGDKVFLYTDGVNEAMNTKGVQYSAKRLKAALSKKKECAIEDIIHFIKEDVAKFTQDAPQSDDITMLAVQFRAKDL